MYKLLRLQPPRPVEQAACQAADIQLKASILNKMLGGLTPQRYLDIIYFCTVAKVPRNHVSALLSVWESATLERGREVNI